MLIGTRALWRHGALLTDQALEVRQGVVRRFRPLGNDTPDVSADLVCPLLTDLQVNGGGGVMVNGDPTADALRHIARTHRCLGTGTILPTVITDTPDVLEAAVDATLAAWGAAGIGGLHIEGPHIALERRGTHDPACIRPLDERTIAQVNRLRDRDIPVMITLAPEQARAAQLRELVSTGAVVSAGHSAADAVATKAALAQGLSCFTHLYNAMPPMSSRSPGLLGTALDSTAYAGIIVDGIHVAWPMVRIALRSRPRRGLTFAVSDAMATVGGPDHFTLYGRTIRVDRGALVNADGALAGAHIDLLASLANLVERVGLPLDEALPMVSDIPRRVMGLAPADVPDGCPIDELLVLDRGFVPMNIGDD